MLSQILASDSHSSSRGMITPRHTLSLLSLTEASTKYSRRLKIISARQLASESVAANGGAISQCLRDFNPF
jgi:hypothetical protein